MFKRLTLCRQFHRTCVRPAAPKAKRVKKILSDLPQTYVLPDGQSAAPLGAFVDASKPVQARACRYCPGRAKSLIKHPAKRKRRSKAVDDSVQSGTSVEMKQGECTEWHATPHLLTECIEEIVETLQPQTQLSRQIRENLQRFPHCLLLTRVGQFYEVRSNGNGDT